MTREMLDKWLEKYNSLEKQYDKEWDRMDKCDREGNIERSKIHSDKMDIISAKQDGMMDALRIFGYTAIYQDGKYVIVTA